MMMDWFDRDAFGKIPPLTIVAGVPYILDTDNAVFINWQSMGNVLRIADMQPCEEGYRFLYDVRSKQMYNQPKASATPELLMVTIPTKLAENKLFNYDWDRFNMESWEKGWTVAKLGSEFEERFMHPELPPAVVVNGTLIWIDCNMETIETYSATYGFNKVMDLDGKDGFRHGFYYNLSAHELVDLPEDLLKFPRNVVFLRLPSLMAIDPVGQAFKDGKFPWAYINQYPVRSRSPVDILPLSRSPAQRLLEDNLMKEQKVKENGKPRQRRGIQ